MKKFLYAFILGLCFSPLYGYILRPIYLTVKYNKKIEDILEKKYNKYSDSWVFVQGKTKHVIHGVILNTGENFLIEDIKNAENNYEDTKVMIVGGKE